MGESSLKLIFLRFFNLCLGENCSIKEMGEWVEGVWQWKWRWRWDLFEREINSLNNLLCLINMYKLSLIDKANGWKWKANRNGSYSTSSAYRLLAEQGEDVVLDGDRLQAIPLVLNKLAPSKVSATTWKLI